MKRRIFLIFAILVVVTLMIGLISRLIHSGGPEDNLKRSELALQAQKYDQAAGYAEEYIAEVPDDWRGPFVLAKIYARQSRFEQAREQLEPLLALPEEKAVNVTIVRILLAETYTIAAQASLRADEQRQSSTLHAAVDSYRQAIAILEPLQPLQIMTDKKALDAKTVMGLAEASVARILYELASEQAREVQIAQEAQAAQAVVEHQQQAETLKAEGRAAYNEAIESLLAILAVDPSQEKVGLAAVELTARMGSAAEQAAVRQAILESPNPSPLPAMLLVLEDLKALTEQEDGITVAELRDKARETADTLDRLLEVHPDENSLRIARAELAWQLLGDAETAQRLVDEVLVTNNRHADARLLSAKLKMARGEYAEAEQELFVLKTEQPGRIDVQYAFAEAALATGKESLARQTFRLITRIEPGHTRASQYMVNSLLREGFAEEAFVDAKAYQQAHPEQSEALRLFVQCAIECGRPEQARTALEAAISSDQANPLLLLTTAQGWLALNEPSAARMAMQRAIGAKPRTLADRLAVSGALEYLERIAQAEHVLTEALAAYPDEPRIAMRFGQLYRRTGRLLQAKQILEQAVEWAESSDPAYRLELARTCFLMGDYDECVKQLESLPATNEGARLLAIRVRLATGEKIDADTAMAQIGGSSWLRRELASAYLEANAPEACATVCRQLLERDPKDREARQLLVEACGRLGELQTRLEQLELLVQQDPELPSRYAALVRTLAEQYPPDQVRSRLETIAGADPVLIDFSLGQHYSGQGNIPAAMEAFGRVVQRPDVPAGVSSQTWLSLAALLHQQGQDADAGRCLDNIPESERIGAVGLGRVRLLSSMGEDSLAEQAAAQVCAQALASQEVDTLKQAGLWYAETGDYDKAFSICDQVDQLLVAEPGPKILRGSVQAACGQVDAAVESYRQAIAKQPANFGIWGELVRMLNEQDRPQQALSVLDELETQGPVAKRYALRERAALLAEWGLQMPAVACLVELSAGDDVIAADEARLDLARALAELGETAKAKELTQTIVATGAMYRDAQLLRARLTEDDGEALAMLQGLHEADPVDTAILREYMTRLMQVDRPGEAVDTFEKALSAGIAKAGPAATALHSLAVQAMLRSGEPAAAGEISRQMAEETQHPLWICWAALLSEESEAVPARLASPRADHNILETAVALYVAQGRSAEGAGQWLERLIMLEAGQSDGDISPYIALGALGTGDAEQARSAAERIDDLTLRAGVESLFQRGPTPTGVRDLLRCLLAIDLGVPAAARPRLLELLQDSSTRACAAALLLRSNPDAALLDQTAQALADDSDVVAEIVRAQRSITYREYNVAAQAWARIASMTEQHPAVLLQQALALENAGQLEQAAGLYEQIWQSTGNPVAANNAAYIRSRLAGNDPQKMQHARSLADAAIAALPHQAGLLDTRGWIALQQGQLAQACTDLRQAVRLAPDAIEIHCHLGLAESSAGNKQSAQWHFSACQALAQAREHSDSPLTDNERAALQLAMDKLNADNQGG